jgi:hypothetical protein
MTQSIPRLFGEEYFLVLMLRMVIEYCTTIKEGEIRSFSIESNTDAIRALAETGLVEITKSEGDDITAIVLPKGIDLVSRFFAERAGVTHAP